MEKVFRYCWACGSLCRDSMSHYKRIEDHHVWGKDNSDFTLPLCLICHDLIDRSKLSDTYEEFLKSIPQLNELLRYSENDNGRYKNLKLMVLKTLKLALFDLGRNSTLNQKNHPLTTSLSKDKEEVE